MRLYITKIKQLLKLLWLVRGVYQELVFICNYNDHYNNEERKLYQPISVFVEISRQREEDEVLTGSDCIGVRRAGIRPSFMAKKGSLIELSRERSTEWHSDLFAIKLKLNI